MAKAVDKKGREYNTCDVCGQCAKKGQTLCKKHAEEFKAFCKERHGTTEAAAKNPYPQGKLPPPPGTWHTWGSAKAGKSKPKLVPIILDDVDTQIKDHIQQKKELAKFLKPKKKKPKPKKKRVKAKGRKVEL